jgi:7,8-dihydropterin-6-yl-methyl-4-(beta-D-ribofuranosyl)aminobenzene 5'-phosphate synthase
MMSVEETSSMTITVVYDNNPYDPRLRTDWGFSCLVELDETTLLFDTGGDGEMLLSNMSRMALDPQEIDHVVLSHIHGDHTGGVRSLLATGVRAVIHVPRSFPESFKDGLRSWTEVRDVSNATTIAEGFHSTGESGSNIIEQSLVIDSPEGLVIVTGCAHPGIVNVVTKVTEIHEGDIYLVMGGFHLRDQSSQELRHVIAVFRRLGVRKVAPSHCTGEQAMTLFAQAWGVDFIDSGAGRVIEIGD